MNTRTYLAISALAIAFGAQNPLASATDVVQAGFNDATGINSNVTPNSPYKIGGPVAGGGVGEPGWSGPWFGSGIVQSATTFEGDGAVEIIPTSANARVLSTPLTGHVLIEEHVRFAPGAALIVYTDQGTTGANQFQAGLLGNISQQPVLRG